MNPVQVLDQDAEIQAKVEYNYFPKTTNEDSQCAEINHLAITNTYFDKQRENQITYGQDLESYEG